METPTIGKLAEALAKAQAEMDCAKKDSINPHFKSKYADIASVIDAIKEPLSKHGLSYVQYIDQTATGGIALITKLMHMSGEWISGCLPLILSKNDMQGLGSALTYARRYSLSAIVGIAQDDDDGNSSNARPDHRGFPSTTFSQGLVLPPTIKPKETEFRLTQTDRTRFAHEAKQTGYSHQDIIDYLKTANKEFLNLTQPEYENLAAHFKKPKVPSEFDNFQGGIVK